MWINRGNQNHARLTSLERLTPRTINHASTTLSRYVVLDRPGNVVKHAASAPLTVYACMPYAGDNEPIPRRENLSPAKLEAEGAPAEVQITLGWEIDARALLINLPLDKFTAWIQGTS